MKQKTRKTKAWAVIDRMTGVALMTEPFRSWAANWRDGYSANAKKFFKVVPCEIIYKV